MIRSRSNDQIKFLQSLRHKKNRDRQNLLPIEGKKLLIEVLESNLTVKTIYLSEKFADQKFIAGISRKIPAIPLIYVSEFVFTAASTMKNPEGVIALIEKPVIKANKYQKYLLLEDIQDPTNLGTIIRSADAAGFEAVVSSPRTVDFYHEKVLRGSMGSVFHLDLIDAPDLIDYIKKLKHQQVTIVGTALEGDNLFDYQFDQKPVALVIGNESKGMSSQAKLLCDHLLKIPMVGKAESLNVSTAAGIILYEIVRQELQFNRKQ